MGATRMLAVHLSGATRILRTIVLLVCFLFQAEDGIRDRLVTGVQTCALPIFKRQLKRAKGKTFALQVFIGFVTFAIQGYNLINEFLRGRHGGQGL